VIPPRLSQFIEQPMHACGQLFALSRGRGEGVDRFARQLNLHGQVALQVGDPGDERRFAGGKILKDEVTVIGCLSFSC
jgi:hypothetical protein